MIFSSRVIPGNESAVARVIDNLVRAIRKLAAAGIGGQREVLFLAEPGQAGIGQGAAAGLGWGVHALVLPR